MPYPDNLLSRGERVVMHKHPHWKVLVLPLLFFILIVGGASFGMAYSRSNTGNWPIWWIAIGVVGVLLLVFLCIVPFIKWRSEHFVVTTRHVFFRTGFFKRREHQIPLGRIQNLEVNVTFWGRIFGFGTLTVDSAAHEPLSFFNVASLPKVQGELNQLIADDREGGGGDGIGDDYSLGSRGQNPPDQQAIRPADTRAYPSGDDPRNYPRDDSFRGENRPQPPPTFQPAPPGQGGGQQRYAGPPPGGQQGSWGPPQGDQQGSWRPPQGDQQGSWGPPQGDQQGSWGPPPGDQQRRPDDGRGAR